MPEIWTSSKEVKLNLRFRILKHTEVIWIPPVFSSFQTAGAQHFKVKFLRISEVAHSESVVTLESVCLSHFIGLRIHFINCLRYPQ